MWAVGVGRAYQRSKSKSATNKKQNVNRTRAIAAGRQPGTPRPARDGAIGGNRQQLSESRKWAKHHAPAPFGAAEGVARPSQTRPRTPNTEFKKRLARRNTVVGARIDPGPGARSLPIRPGFPRSPAAALNRPAQAIPPPRSVRALPFAGRFQGDGTRPARAHTWRQGPARPSLEGRRRGVVGRGASRARQVADPTRRPRIE